MVNAGTFLVNLYLARQSKKLLPQTPKLMPLPLPPLLPPH
jgi:hypothetical protein